MTAIPNAAGVLTSALGRFERASMRRLEAATGLGENDDIVTPAAEMTKAEMQARAGLAVVRFSDLMWAELIEAQGRDRDER